MAIRDPKTKAINAVKLGELLNNSTLQGMYKSIFHFSNIY